MQNLFHGETLGTNNITVIDFSKVEVPNRVTYATFKGLGGLEQIIGLKKINTTKMRTMESMFLACSALKKLDLSGFETSNVTNMSSMFSNCGGLKTLDLNNFDTSNVTNMSYMFNWCNSLETLDVSTFNIGKVSNMSSMFSTCTRLSEESLNGILKMLSTVNALSAANRKLNTIGLTQLQAEKCTTLSNWNLAKAAGWTTGY